MGTFSALLAICAGNSPVPGEFPSQMPVTRSFDVFFNQHPNDRLSKHSWGWWFETHSPPLWRHNNVLAPLDARASAADRWLFRMYTGPAFIVFGITPQYDIYCHVKQSVWIIWPNRTPEWGLLKFRTFISPFAIFSIVQNCVLDTLNHVHIWQVWLQYSCGYPYQVWTWCSAGDMYMIILKTWENNGRRKLV